MTDTSHAQSPPKAKESCRSCLYTGVATCTGLSGYFFHLAMEEESPRSAPKMNGGVANAAKGLESKSSMQHIPITSKSSTMKFLKGYPVAKQNRLFLFALSAFCAGAGAYRLYLN